MKQKCVEAGILLEGITLPLDKGVEVGFFSRIADITKLLSNLCKSQNDIDRYYNFVKELKVISLDLNNCIFNFTQRASTLCEVNTISDLMDLIELGLNILSKSTGISYLDDFRRLTSLGATYRK